VSNERPIPQWLLAVLRCPITFDPLRDASPELCQALNELAQRGDLCNKLGVTISSVSPQGLVNASNTWFYERRDSILHLMPDEAISIGEITAKESPTPES
jgi:uncharacterized protein YbaR (Trm112 family)